jgi:catechol 2,3-dioxygenase-like lactoylglutathione lyase family enzyme
MTEPARSRLGAISPLFIVRSLADSVAFYRSLGFRLALCVPEDRPFFASVERDDARLFLKEIGPEVEPCPNRKLHEWARWDAFVPVEDPERLEAEWRGRAVLAEPLATGDDGLRGFAIADPDGHVLYFGRPARDSG